MAMLALPGLAAAGEQPIVAVFDVEFKRMKASPDLVDGLTDYLFSRLVESGAFQIVPRAQVRERLGDEKKKSFQACFDQACQVEIGRELAAQKTLATKVIRIGDSCSLTATLFDLRRAAAEQAATAKGDCDEPGLLKSLDAAVAKLAGPTAALEPKQPSRADPETPRMLVNGGGKCLDAKKREMRSKGGGIQLWKCHGKQNQLWTLKDGLLVSAGGTCLDVKAKRANSDGADVQLWKCHGKPNQRWRIVNGQLINEAGGRCLDAKKNAMHKNGGGLQLWRCHPVRQQRWHFNGKALVNAGGKCLEVPPPGAGGPLSRVHINACQEGVQQSWRLEDGKLVNGGGLCLGVPPSKEHRNGAQVEVQGCASGSHQEWTLEDGRLANGGGRCLSVFSRELGTDGGKVHVWECARAPQQHWAWK